MNLGKKKQPEYLFAACVRSKKNKLVTNSNHHNPRKLWLLLTNHYESTSANNQAKVYQKFCNLEFTKDISLFYDNLNLHLANMTAVGLKVGIPENFHLHKNLLAKQIIDKLPDSLVTTKDHLFTKQPLTLDTLEEHLQNKISDLT